MYDKDHNSLTQTLQQMAEHAINKCNGNQVKAFEKVLPEYISQDLRFSGWKPERLSETVQKCRDNGSYLDFDDPYLKGGARADPHRHNRHSQQSVPQDQANIETYRPNLGAGPRGRR